MSKQITPFIEHFYDDEEIWQIIAGNANLLRQVREPELQENPVCVVMPLVRRYPGYQTHQFDLDVFIKHPFATELGQWELYRVRDFIRQSLDLAPLLQRIRFITGVDIQAVLESIRRQIQFLQKAENQDLPMASAQLLHLYDHSGDP